MIREIPEGRSGPWHLREVERLMPVMGSGEEGVAV